MEFINLKYMVPQAQKTLCPSSSQRNAKKKKEFNFKGKKTPLTQGQRPSNSLEILYPGTEIHKRLENHNPCDKNLKTAERLHCRPIDVIP